jgi:hypothetical protein
MLDGQVFLVAGQHQETIDRMITEKWLEKETIEGVGEVYTLTKEGFHWLSEEYWKGHA